MPCPPGDHLFWPAAASTARRMAARGHPPSYLVGCALCGTTVDLVAALRSAPRSAVPGTAGADPVGDRDREQPDQRHPEDDEHRYP